MKKTINFILTILGALFCPREAAKAVNSAEGDIAPRDIWG